MDQPNNSFTRAFNSREIPIDIERQLYSIDVLIGISILQTKNIFLIRSPDLGHLFYKEGECIAKAVEAKHLW